MASKAPSSATQVVNFITGNKNKLSEVKAILEPTISVRSEAIDVIEVQGSLEEVTIAKCKSAAEQVGLRYQYTALHHNSVLLTHPGAPTPPSPTLPSCHHSEIELSLTGLFPPLRSEVPFLWRTPASASTL